MQAALAGALAQALAAWPNVRVDERGMARALAELAPKPLDPPKPLGEVLVADFYLAFGCAAGDPAAVAECDAMLVREAGFAADGARDARIAARRSNADRARAVARTARK